MCSSLALKQTLRFPSPQAGVRTLVLLLHGRGDQVWFDNTTLLDQMFVTWKRSFLQGDLVSWWQEYSLLLGESLFLDCLSLLSRQYFLVTHLNFCFETSDQTLPPHFGARFASRWLHPKAEAARLLVFGNIVPGTCGERHAAFWNLCFSVLPTNRHSGQIAFPTPQLQAESPG